MLRKDLSTLPSPSTDDGLTPDSDNQFVTVLVDELAKQPRKPQVSDTLTRHSSAASCLFRVALLRDGVEPEPMDLAGHHVTNMGTLMHEAWQASLAREFEGRVEFEVPSTIEDLTSGSCDAAIWPEQVDHRENPEHILELKTSGGFAHKMMVGERGAAQGPKTEHMVQLALNVMGLDADKGTLVYLSREAISIGAAGRKGIDEVTRFGAQWTFDRATLQPLADEWLEQLRWVRDHPTEQVPRFWPHQMQRGARIVDPTASRWELRDGDDIIDTGSVWGGSGCLYCPVQEACVSRWKEEQ